MTTYHHHNRKLLGSNRINSLQERMLSRQEGSSPSCGASGGESPPWKESELWGASPPTVVCYHRQAELVKTKGDSRETGGRMASSVGSSDSRWEWATHTSYLSAHQTSSSPGPRKLSQQLWSAHLFSQRLKNQRWELTHHKGSWALSGRKPKQAQAISKAQCNTSPFPTFFISLQATPALLTLSSVSEDVDLNFSVWNHFLRGSGFLSRINENDISGVSVSFFSFHQRALQLTEIHLPLLPEGLD